MKQRSIVFGSIVFDVVALGSLTVALGGFALVRLGIASFWLLAWPLMFALIRLLALYVMPPVGLLLVFVLLRAELSTRTGISLALTNVIASLVLLIAVVEIQLVCQ
jgi:hypothetical protein